MIPAGQYSSPCLLWLRAGQSESLGGNWQPMYVMQTVSHGFKAQQDIPPFYVLLFAHPSTGLWVGHSRLHCHFISMHFENSSEKTHWELWKWALEHSSWLLFRICVAQVLRIRISRRLHAAHEPMTHPRFASSHAQRTLKSCSHPSLEKLVKSKDMPKKLLKYMVEIPSTPHAELAPSKRISIKNAPSQYTSAPIILPPRPCLIICFAAYL